MGTCSRDDASRGLESADSPANADPPFLTESRFDAVAMVVATPSDAGLAMSVTLVIDARLALALQPCLLLTKDRCEVEPPGPAMDVARQRPTF
ncbi:hypothetical protein BASA62_007297 [Batrachochytrium salamandrivorans]|nr:hypothetical protein BASA62_007297 [Batrachochytrium salamandrivorans]